MAEHVAGLISDGQVVGLGTGHEAMAFIEALGKRVRSGLRISGIPTSEASAALARQLNIPLTTLDAVERTDVDVDGADEVDPQLNLIKGYGGGLVRGKIVATAARRFVVLVGPEKLVSQLGARGRLPVEIVPFAAATCRRAVTALGLVPELRLSGSEPFVTDNGNWILDCHVAPIADAAALDAALRSIPGIVGSGLFLSMAHTVFVHHGAGFDRRDRGTVAGGK
jgi:ribose 5-phosphate isomerase A